MKVQGIHPPLPETLGNIPPCCLLDEQLSESQQANVCTVCCSTPSHLDGCCQAFYGSCDGSISSIEGDSLSDEQSVILFDQSLFEEKSMDVRIKREPALDQSLVSDLHCILDEENSSNNTIHKTKNEKSRRDEGFPSTTLEFHRTSKRGWESDIPSLKNLPDELLCSITSFLDVKALVRIRTTSKRMWQVGSRDEAGWLNHCLRLWKGKVYVSDAARSLVQNQAQTAIRAYQLSRHDGRYRHEITVDELCFDVESGKGVVWSFRFKEKAGPAWTSWDPWWSGREPRKMVFLRDGRVMQLLPADARSKSFDTTVDGKKYRLLQAFDDSASGFELVQDQRESQGPMTWRFITKPLDLPIRPAGAYIRLKLGARDVPTYIVHRSPTGNWGFVLESCWGVYVSFDLPKRQLPSPAPETHPRRSMRMRLRRTRDGARWLNVDGIESDSEDEQEPEPSNNKRRRPSSTLLDDSSLAVTHGWQWKEALLYNFGAGALPEGKEATQEFDRVW
eukprot:CAMPEP_0118692042 /NCGR_PEP_ID=MMETSP0800-20121206/11034_1 /TAXON_ID=210618 ORGANISM="Striatella unipunctata, Strain CCMP2910" /NCGR_SAMPLE_ID=MMETSP0800 /ASSEMBLY_ACC=CAM_ASM_000638 /LENGTH=503 /DNA_ID=CAMNT_0006589925 /DNA_START=33 /DNA_END=1541 /DNA_ORIENTATION=-